MHAVHQLYQYRKGLSTTEFKARGQRVKRCELCRLSIDYCICDHVPKTSSDVGFLLLMYDTEVLKPSNTGRLIADLIPDTYAFLWSRTQENQQLLDLLDDQQWQPYVVFPKQYADSERKVYTSAVHVPIGKKPLLIMLDGSWREAKKMFRKSPYLERFPMISIDLDMFEGDKSRYQIRNAAISNQLATAEVAARVLAMVGEEHNSQLLDLWFDVFNFQYQRSVCQTNKGNPSALENINEFVEKTRSQ